MRQTLAVTCVESDDPKALLGPGRAVRGDVEAAARPDRRRAFETESECIHVVDVQAEVAQRRAVETRATTPAGLTLSVPSVSQNTWNGFSAATASRTQLTAARFSASVAR